MGITLKINLTKETINLSKNEIVNLSKHTETGLNRIKVALGWDPVEKSYASGDFLESLFDGLSSLFGGSSKGDYDLDAWLGLYTHKNEYVGVVYFNNLKYFDDNRNCVIQHFGDNLTGQGKGDNEVIEIKLNELPALIGRISVGVTIYMAESRHQSFDVVKNTFVRIVDERDDFEICRFDANEISNGHGATTFYAGDLVKDKDGSWNFKAIGTHDKSRDITQAVRTACNMQHTTYSE